MTACWGSLAGRVEILNAGALGVPTTSLLPWRHPWSWSRFPALPVPPGLAASVPLARPGPPGTSNQSFSAESQAFDNSGTELVWWQFSANLSNQPAGTLTLDFTMLASSDAGTAIYRVYVGGAFLTAIGAAPTGVLAATATRNGAGFVKIPPEWDVHQPDRDRSDSGHHASRAVAAVGCEKQHR